MLYRLEFSEEQQQWHLEHYIDGLKTKFSENYNAYYTIKKIVTDAEAKLLIPYIEYYLKNNQDLPMTVADIKIELENFEFVISQLLKDLK